MPNKYTHVIWDWNGTLLDDAEWCLSCINTLLKARSLQPIADLRAYRDVFGFPVKDYYHRAGFNFDKEPFEIPAAEFIDLYHSDNSRFRLFNGAAEVLAAVNRMGLQQAILSASELSNLRSQICLFDIERYLDDIIGISNIYAESKVTAGQEYVARKGLDSSNTVLVGDTAHDHEVAQALGVHCILIANGHQHREVLLKCGVPVLGCITDIPEFIL